VKLLMLFLVYPFAGGGRGLIRLGSVRILSYMTAARRFSYFLYSDTIAFNLLRVKSRGCVSRIIPYGLTLPLSSTF
jgi:hypothetical protein